MTDVEIKRLVHGVGRNDADYAVWPTINGKSVPCKHYLAWVNMLMRCYSPSYVINEHSYIGCTVIPEWHSFSAFKAWMVTNDWEGKELDKDLLVKGNKLYSPSTCAFIPRKLNLFITDRAADRGAYPIGVSYHKRDGRFQSQCANPFTKKRDFLGLFDCPQEAHEAWRTKKHEHACTFADQQSDPRLSAALRARYRSEVSQ